MRISIIQSIVEIICSFLTASGIVYGIRSQVRENHYRSVSIKISRSSIAYSNLTEFHLLLKTIDNSSIKKCEKELLVDELYNKTIIDGKSMYFNNQICITDYCKDNPTFAALCLKYETFSKHRELLSKMIKQEEL